MGQWHAICAVGVKISYAVNDIAIEPQNIVETSKPFSFDIPKTEDVGFHLV